jgi:hypothetical protein
MKVAAPPYSMPSMKSFFSNSNRSTVIWQAMNLTSDSMHTARSSSSEATPFFFILAFIIVVAIHSMPGSICTMTGIGTGIGIAGLARGLIAMPLKSLRSSCRP